MRLYVPIILSYFSAGSLANLHTLPTDIIERVLSSLDIHSLANFNLVSKSYRDLVSMHFPILDASSPQNRRIKTTCQEMKAPDAFRDHSFSEYIMKNMFNPDAETFDGDGVDYWAITAASSECLKSIGFLCHRYRDYVAPLHLTIHEPSMIDRLVHVKSCPLKLALFDEMTLGEKFHVLETLNLVGLTLISIRYDATLHATAELLMRPSNKVTELSIIDSELPHTVNTVIAILSSKRSQISRLEMVSSWINNHRLNELVPWLSNIRHLNLLGNSIRRTGLESLGQFLISSSSNMKSLNLVSNDLSSDDYDYLFTSVLPNSSIEELYFSFNVPSSSIRLFFSVLPTTTVRRLSIYVRSLSSTLMDIIRPTFPRIKLTHLSIQIPAIADRHVAEWIKYLPNDLEELKLSLCAIGSITIRALAALIQRNGRLTSLVMVQNSIRNADMLPLVDAIRDTRKLKLFELAHNQMSDYNVQLLKNVLNSTNVKIIIREQGQIIRNRL